MKTTNWRKVKKSLKTEPQEVKSTVIYAGFWSRVLSFVIDVFMIGIPISLVIMSLFGHDQMQSISAMDVLQGIKPLDENGVEIKPDPMIAIIQIGLFSFIVIMLWKFDHGRTPGKRLSKTKILDAKTHAEPAFWKLIVRFFAYFLSFISIIGFLIPLVHPKKMALHDMVSGTIVVYDLD
jgi:uncharacterized RDD family membrane protein YckC